MMAVKIVYSYQHYEINISRQRALISTRCDSWRHARCLVADDVGGIIWQQNCNNISGWAMMT